MVNYTLYVADEVADVYKNFGVVIHEESEAVTYANTGKGTLVFKDGTPWKFFDGFGTAYRIMPE